MKHWDGVCAFDQLRKSYAEFERRAYKAFNAHKAPENRERDLHAIVGEGYAQTQIYRADLRAGLKAGTIFVGLMSKMFGRTLEREARGNAGTHFAFATFIHSDWNSSDRTAAINLQSIRNKVSKAIRDAGLNGIAVIEVQALTNYPEQGKGKTLMTNVHALVWARTPIEHATWVATVEGSAAWQADFGCPPLVVKALSPDSLDDRANVMRVSAYMMKAPHDAKFRKPQKKNPEHYKFRPTTKGYTHRLAFRIFECLSYLPLLEMVFGVGNEGVKWCNRWRSGLRKWHQRRFTKETSAREVNKPKFWKKYRKKSGTEKYEPFQLLRGRERSVHVWHPDGNNGSTKTSTKQKPAAPSRRARAARKNEKKRRGVAVLHPARPRKPKPRRTVIDDL